MERLYEREGKGREEKIRSKQKGKKEYWEDHFLSYRSTLRRNKTVLKDHLKLAWSNCKRKEGKKKNREEEKKRRKEEKKKKRRKEEKK